LAATGSFVATEKIINVFLNAFLLFLFESQSVHLCMNVMRLWLGLKTKNGEKKKRGCYLLFEADQKNAFLCNFLVMHFGTLTCRTRFDDHIKNCITSNKL
jgi:hypothetical protein